MLWLSREGLIAREAVLNQSIPSGLAILGLLIGTLVAIGWLADTYPQVRELGALFGIR